MAAKKGVSPWIKFGLPVFVLVAIGAIVGGVVGSRASKKNNDSSSSSPAAQQSSAEAAQSALLEVGRFATATNAVWGVPLYPSMTNSAAFTTPTFQPSSDLSWGEDTFKPSNPTATSVRPDRPRLIAPAYKWERLPALISGDPYMKGWNESIFGNATEYAGLSAVQYVLDGGNGILDNAREIKMRVKAFSYAYRMSRDTRWSDLAWREIENAMSSSFGPATDKWNPSHFLDVAELSAAFGIVYDWLHDILSDDQKTQLREGLIQNGLRPGVAAYTDSSVSYGWWRTNIQGNWNCVCNSGLSLGALAILGDDTSGIAEQILGLTIDNAKQNCIDAVTSDGTWAETPNYWYFGTTGHAEFASALMTATGSDYGLLDQNENFKKTGDAHMHGFGSTSLFDYGDSGPNKFSATANCMFLYGSHYQLPRYTLFQREQRDAAEPWSMFWYDPSVSGAFWDDTPLDGFFDDDSDQWVAMRSSWTDQNALYVAMKAGRSQSHQAHNDLDVGDFVLDALGTRWAGEYGNGDYLSAGYFTSDAQDAQRWTYFRKRTEGQNTLTVNNANQLVSAAPTIKHDTSGTKQSGGSTVFAVPDDSNVFWTTDMSSAYADATSVKRGVRMINQRRQVLLQDEITASQSVQWRIQTNATITTSGTSATLERDGKRMSVSILNAPSGAEFSSGPAQRSAPADGVTDQENPGVSILQINLPAGQYSLQVLFNPQWEDGFTDFKTPGSVALDGWSLTSHNT